MKNILNICWYIKKKLKEIKKERMAIKHIVTLQPLLDQVHGGLILILKNEINKKGKR